jgi:hypothetical protein
MVSIELSLVETILQKIVNKNCTINEVLDLKKELNVNIIEIIDILEFLIKTETIEMNDNMLSISNPDFMKLWEK